MRASAYDDLPGPTAVVCHDAGAANAIFYGLQRRNGQYRIWATGPAATIAASCGLPSNATSMQDALDGAAVLLSGSGWASDLEHDARRIARDTQVPSIAVLDHWVNYPTRFIRHNEIVHPDRWWVSDEFAKLEAEKYFPADRIDLVPNYYVERQLAQISAVTAVTPPVLLYVLEPARSNWGNDRPGEFQALDYLIEKLHSLALPDDVVVRLRPHPSDPPGKYDLWVEQQKGVVLEFDKSPDMAVAISQARWVAGCESFGLVLALDASRPVFCTLPPGAPPCRLPQDRLIHLRAME